MHFLNGNVWLSIKISLKFVDMEPINNIPVLVQIMACRRPGDKPLSEPMVVSLPTHVCYTRPQWVNYNYRQWTICSSWISCYLQTKQYHFWHILRHYIHWYLHLWQTGLNLSSWIHWCLVLASARLAVILTGTAKLCTVCAWMMVRTSHRWGESDSCSGAVPKLCDEKVNSVVQLFQKLIWWLSKCVHCLHTLLIKVIIYVVPMVYSLDISHIESSLVFSTYTFWR